jgi:hypothetical protein
VISLVFPLSNRTVAYLASLVCSLTLLCSCGNTSSFEENARHFESHRQQFVAAKDILLKEPDFEMFSSNEQGPDERLTRQQIDANSRLMKNLNVIKLAKWKDSEKGPTHIEFVLSSERSFTDAVHQRAIMFTQDPNVKVPEKLQLSIKGWQLWEDWSK